jgi:hypothetical protein
MIMMFVWDSFAAGAAADDEAAGEVVVGTATGRGVGVPSVQLA